MHLFVIQMYVCVCFIWICSICIFSFVFSSKKKEITNVIRDRSMEIGVRRFLERNKRTGNFPSQLTWPMPITMGWSYVSFFAGAFFVNGRGKGISMFGAVRKKQSNEEKSGSEPRRGQRVRLHGNALYERFVWFLVRLVLLHRGLFKVGLDGWEETEQTDKQDDLEFWCILFVRFPRFSRDQINEMEFFHTIYFVLAFHMSSPIFSSNWPYILIHHRMISSSSPLTTE